MFTGHGGCVRPLADIGCRETSTKLLIVEAALVALGKVATPLLQGAPYKDIARRIAHACIGRRS